MYYIPNITFLPIIMEDTPKSKRAKTHRRKKCQIERKFICQIENCDKSYGQESSLRTHMTLKHRNAVHAFPPKQKSEQSGRPRKVQPHKNQEKEGYKFIWEDSKFTEFLQIVLGIEPCDWIREDEMEFFQFNVDNLVHSILKRNQGWKVPEALMRYFEKGKQVFLPESIGELYFKIVRELNRNGESKKRKWVVKLQELFKEK